MNKTASAKHQRGMGMLGAMGLIVLLLIVIVIGMKVGPAYMEYFSIKRALATAVERGGGSPASIQSAFNKQAQVNSIESIRGADLRFEKNGSETVASFAYQQSIPLTGNVTLVIDFEGSSD